MKVIRNTVLRNLLNLFTNRIINFIKVFIICTTFKAVIFRLYNNYQKCILIRNV